MFLKSQKRSFGEFLIHFALLFLLTSNVESASKKSSGTKKNSKNSPKASPNVLLEQLFREKFGFSFTQNNSSSNFITHTQMFVANVDGVSAQSLMNNDESLVDYMESIASPDNFTVPVIFIIVNNYASSGNCSKISGSFSSLHDKKGAGGFAYQSSWSYQNGSSNSQSQSQGFSGHNGNNSNTFNWRPFTTFGTTTTFKPMQFKPLGINRPFKK